MGHGSRGSMIQGGSLWNQSTHLELSVALSILDCLLLLLVFHKYIATLREFVTQCNISGVSPTAIHRAKSRCHLQTTFNARSSVKAANVGQHRLQSHSSSLCIPCHRRTQVLRGKDDVAHFAASSRSQTCRVLRLGSTKRSFLHSQKPWFVAHSHSTNGSEHDGVQYLRSFSAALPRADHTIQSGTHARRAILEIQSVDQKLSCIAKAQLVRSSPSCSHHGNKKHPRILVFSPKTLRRSSL
eukprot:COSAG01_NODE_1840_length_9078_cov_149.015481_13_plen_241_part_00